MSALSLAVVLQLAYTCQSAVSPGTIARIAQVESGFNPTAVHQNTDGSRDRGLMQINERNDAWLGLHDPFDPCQSIHAAGRLLASFSRYNTGSPTKGVANGYATRVQAVRIATSVTIKASAPSPRVSVFLSPHPAQELVFASPQ